MWWWALSGDEITRRPVRSTFSSSEVQIHACACDFHGGLMLICIWSMWIDFYFFLVFVAVICRVLCIGNLTSFSWCFLFGGAKVDGSIWGIDICYLIYILHRQLFSLNHCFIMFCVCFKIVTDAFCQHVAPYIYPFLCLINILLLGYEIYLIELWKKGSFCRDS